MSDPIVSIIVPCYNASRWIAAAIEAALRQTWAATNIVVVDDGSSDDSLSIIRAYEAQGLHVINQPNRGASAARNAGLRVAKGDYVQFLDADDLLAPDKIERQILALRDAPANSIATCMWGNFSDDPRDATFAPEPVWADFAPVDWLVCSWSGGGMMHPAAWLVPRSVADLAGPWNESLSLDDDGEFFCRAVLASAGVKFVRDALTYYRVHDGPRLSAGRGPVSASSSFSACLLKERHLLSAEDSPRTRRAIAMRFAGFAWEQLNQAPELAALAIRRWHDLAPGAPGPRGSRWHGVLAFFVGWKLARRVQLWWQDARHPRASRRDASGHA